MTGGVLFLSAEYPPLEGGVGDYTACLAAAMARSAITPGGVAVLTGVGGCPDAAPGVATVPAIRDWGWGALSAIRRVVQTRRPAVLHIQYQTAAYGMHPAINLLPHWLRATLPARSRPRLVTTFHDLRPPYLFPKAGPVRGLAAAVLAAGCDAYVVTAPEAMAGRAGRRLRRLAPRATRHARAIPIGSNIAVRPPADFARDDWRRRLGVGDASTFLVGHFGLVNRSKGLDDLLRAVAALAAGGRDVRLAVIGGTPGASDPTNRAWWAAMHALTADLGLTDRVTWTGFLAEAEVSAALLAVDAVALPYRDGATFARGTLMAALAHGRPIVTTAPPPTPRSGLWRDWPRLVDGEHALLTPPGDPAALAAALAHVAADAELRDRLDGRAAELAMCFTWDRIAAQTADLHAELIAAANGGARC